MASFRIKVIDFMPELGKHLIGEKDSVGKDLAIGDIVEHSGDKHMIVYRYGTHALKQPFTIHTLIITDWSKTTKLNEVHSTPDYVICGEEEEPLYEAVKHLLEASDD